MSNSDQDDYEYQQELYAGKTVGVGDGGPLKDIFDASFNGPRSELYRAEVVRELFPHEKPMMIRNWPRQDLEMYVGGEWTPGYLRLVKGDA